MNSTNLLSISRGLLILLPALTTLFMGCERITPTGPPGAIYPMLYRPTRVMSLSEIDAVVRDDGEWIEIELRTVPPVVDTALGIDTTSSPFFAWDITLRSATTFAFFDDPSMSGFEYIWENDRFQFTDSDVGDDVMIGIGNADGFSVPVMISTRSTTFTTPIALTYVDDRGAPRDALSPHGIGSDRSDTVYYRTLWVVYEPEG